MKIAHMSWRQVQEAVDRQALVILPTGATEAHGAHMPNDADTHQAEHVASLVADRIDAVVAPAVPLGRLPLRISRFLKPCRISAVPIS